MVSELFRAYSGKLYEARRLRNLDAQNTRTVPNRITAPGSGTPVMLPSTLNVAPPAPEINASSNVKEYAAGPANWLTDDEPDPPVPRMGPTEPTGVVFAKLVFVLDSYAVWVVLAAPVSEAL